MIAHIFLPRTGENGDARALDPRPLTLRFRLVSIYLVLGALNLGAWAWAFIAFFDKPMLLGVALAVYGLGLRHALDADHIAAIDNVTRRQMRSNARPVTVGFYFALGHSSIVIFATALLAGSADVFERFARFHLMGACISTTISAAFLIFVAGMNIMIFRSILSAWRRGKSTGEWSNEDSPGNSVSYGFLVRLLRPMLRLVSKSWHMFPLGFLFGLGFDTATEVAMFGVSAAHAAKGAPLMTTLIFPILFAAGMALIDTTDGVMMLGAYDWALLNPRRKMAYNLGITGISIAVALMIGFMEIISLVKKSLYMPRWVNNFTDTFEINLNFIGISIVILFILFWAISFYLHNIRKTESPI